DVEVREPGQSQRVAEAAAARALEVQHEFPVPAPGAEIQRQEARRRRFTRRAEAVVPRVRTREITVMLGDDVDLATDIEPRVGGMIEEGTRLRERARRRSEYQNGGRSADDRSHREIIRKKRARPRVRTRSQNSQK